MSMAPACAWCDRPFTPRHTGGHDQRFCRQSCRRALHSVVRRWVLAELAAGRLSLDAIKSGLPATRALITGTVSPSPLTSDAETLEELLVDLVIALPDGTKLPGAVQNWMRAYIDRAL